MSESTQAQQILLDTSVLIDIDALWSALPESIESCISAVSIAELAAGLRTTEDPIEQTRRQLQFQWVSKSFDPLVFDAETGDIYGSLAFLVHRIGRKPRKRIADLQIAATAVQHSLPLYTRNMDDFKGLEPLLNIVPI